ncbi:MAG: hypothetical protein Unbinned1693contig1002_13 [Prokaryotic dsDNA virus sp.]|jgi:hypothetical protein|nr:MAG: hypothetical protein Unbinned1693contig1002_13 [Prokaryotic dsDNA virus sp.]|tara:strand:+ start:9551 stop:9742 length:192 start_codon:yes stop_codon:yes gene_type:complete
MKDPMERKVTTSVSVTVRNQLWIDEQRDKCKCFTFSGFVNACIANAMKEEYDEPRKNSKASEV